MSFSSSSTAELAPQYFVRPAIHTIFSRRRALAISASAQTNSSSARDGSFVSVVSLAPPGYSEDTRTTVSGLKTARPRWYPIRSWPQPLYVQSETLAHRPVRLNFVLEKMNETNYSGNSSRIHIDGQTYRIALGLGR